MKGRIMEWVLFYGLIPFLVASLTGGIAGAVLAREGEHRSLLANAGIGLVGWAAAWLIMTVIRGDSPDEVTIGIGLLALASSVGFLYLVERRGKGMSQPAPPV
jgi:hypothetical protein